MHGREPLTATRIVADPPAIEFGSWPAGSVVLRTAPDEVLVIGGGRPEVSDPYAIVMEDTGWHGFTVATPNAALVMEQMATWPLPVEGFAQGMVAGIATKVWVGRLEVLFVVPSAVSDVFADRLDEVWERET